MGEGLRVRLRVLIPAVENAIAGNAFRPATSSGAATARRSRSATRMRKAG